MYSMNTQTVGRCSICGGRVSVPAVWMGIYPPTPTCDKCGATAKPEDGLPVIPMTPRGSSWGEP